jgi:hypothetical protein
MITAALPVFAAVLPVGVIFPFDVLPSMLRMRLLQSNNLLVPFGVAWAALGVFFSVEHANGKRDHRSGMTILANRHGS